MRRRAHGFSLIETIVVIAIISLLAGALAPMVIQQRNVGRMEATRRAMQGLVTGMLGDPATGTFGYVGDMGALPPTLLDLNDGSGKPAFVRDVTGIGQGFGGPYAPTVRLGAGGTFVDAWNVAYDYAGAGQIRSAGPDRTLNNADDLLVPPSPLPTVGDLVVRVFGLPNTGDPAMPLGAAEADVFVAHSNGGNFAELALVEPIGGPGPFTATGIHVGHHGLRAEGGGSYLGADTVRSVVTVHGGTVVTTLTLVQP